MSDDKQQRDYYIKNLVTLGDGVLNVELYNPVAPVVEIGLEHVRAADNIRIQYDFERDGYAILQSRWTATDQTGELWQEVAFVQAWALDERAENS